MSRFVGTLRQKAKKLGLDGDMVYQRVHRGWTEEEALLTPVGDRRPDRLSTTTALIAQPETMLEAAEAWRVKGDKKRATIVNKLLIGED